MIKLYSKENCPACTQAKRLMDRLSIDFEEFDLMQDEKKMLALKDMGYTQMPIIEVDDDVYSTGFRPEIIRKLKK